MDAQIDIKVQYPLNRIIPIGYAVWSEFDRKRRKADPPG
jgi:hypothetical protein